MPGFGRQVASATTGNPVKLSASSDTEYVAGGVTMDWSTVAAVSGSDVTLPNGDIVPVGRKYLRYGQTLTRITASGKFGPYDPAAADGRQTLARGDAVLVNETTLEKGALGIDILASDFPTVINGGTVWKSRLLATAGTHSLAAGPTFAELEAVLPRLKYAQD